MERLAEHGIEVIAGLLHHGSGPHYTSLLDPDFPRKFADYAARVAERYPRIVRWTPINEPLTTARFSALYGHWYPHARDYGAFLRALVNQCRGIAAAMTAIRAAVPGAQLVQTEDLGKTFSTPPLAYQADHENERRWLSLDLLAGRVEPAHPLFRFLIDAGIPESEIAELGDGGAAPDLIGINHYLTSERFLDHRLHLHPGQEQGGNGRDSYVDVEAVRVAGLEHRTGLAARLSEAWERYRIPLAVTEVHHGCTRDEQLRWLIEAADAAQRARRGGAQVRAITLWSLFGSVDWRSLLTRRDGAYDPGAFDVRAPEPRPTVLARAARALAAGEPFDHPVLDSPGWWRRPARLHGSNGPDAAQPAGRKILIIGASGTLGRALARVAARRGLAFHLSARDELDLLDPSSIAATFERRAPWAVVNAAGFVRVAEAEDDWSACYGVNAVGAENLAKMCAARKLPFVTFSSDLVFDGSLGRRYHERDRVMPAGVYGASKAAAERAVSRAWGEALIVRTSAFFGPWDVHNFAWGVTDALRRGMPVRACARTFASPTFVPDLCHAVLDLLIDGETGIWHLANQGAVSWYGFARMLAERGGFDPDLVIEDSGSDLRNTALVSERGTIMRPFDQAVEAYLRDIELAAPEALAAE